MFLQLLNAQFKFIKKYIASYFGFQMGMQRTTENPMFGLNTEKTHVTDKRVLEGADVGVCGLKEWRQSESQGKTTALRLAITCLYPELNLSHRSDDQRVFTTVLSRTLETRRSVCCGNVRVAVLFPCC